MNSTMPDSDSTALDSPFLIHTMPALAVLLVVYCHKEGAGRDRRGMGGGDGGGGGRGGGGGY